MRRISHQSACMIQSTNNIPGHEQGETFPGNMELWDLTLSWC